jgi:SPP1 gp7 family putative phage head morphogenesis protein
VHHIHAALSNVFERQLSAAKSVTEKFRKIFKAEKFTHAEVEFEHPAKGPHHCSECQHYGGVDDCELVKSPIAPDDWCNKFEASADKLAKSEGSDLADNILDAIERYWDSVPGLVRPQLQNANLSGVGAGMLQLAVNDSKITASANQSAADFAAERAAELVGKKYNDDGELVDNPRAEWAISDTTRDKIRQIITDSFADDTNLTDVRDDIVAALEDEADDQGIFSKERAMMIARTEITRAQNAGNFSVWEDSGIVKSIRWISSEDEKVCDVCEGNDGIVVNLGEAFPSGDQYPGAHPACRCAVIVEATR